MALRIEDYAMIGDCETAALVGRDGSIDWLCWPRFDSAACFAALLGTLGQWPLAPCPKVSAVGSDTALSPWHTHSRDRISYQDRHCGVVDFMPPADGVADLVRIVCGLAGQVSFQYRAGGALHYGATVPWVTRIEDGTIEAIAGPEQIVLRTSAELYGEDLKTVGEFVIDADNPCPLCCPMGVLSKVRRDRSIRWRRSNARRHFGANGASDVRAVGPWTEAVKRSLITLKALTYAPTGAIVAAATTSLPERPGGTGIGTTDIVGCVTPHSRSWLSCIWVITKKQGHGASGSIAR